MGACFSILEVLVTPPPNQPGTANTLITNGGAGTASHAQHHPASFQKPSTSSSSYGTASPIYSQLPSGAEKQAVRNVYDGDTLTLKDERRVRFLGVDTPELKEHQPFAQEAKDYTKSKIKDHLYMVVEDSDHYGRLLAWVYVEDGGGGYLCVNEGLIQQGYAYCYIPDSNSKPKNWNKLLQLQANARQSKRGVWNSFIDASVVATTNGAAYHKSNCSHLSKSRNLTHLTISEATDRGLHPCRTCMG
jgi:micrococcal nuclease